MSDVYSTEWDSPGHDDVDVDVGGSSSASASTSHQQQSPQSSDEFYGNGVKNSREAVATAIARVMENADNVFFKCSVSDPQKEQEGQNAYISYLVTTETNSPSFTLPNCRVRRRFSDFVYLFESLNNEFPASAVPPLPDKSRLEYLKGDRFALDFTLKRAASLTRFLTRIGQHPFLKKSRVFYTFLESDDWNTFKKHKGANRVGSSTAASNTVTSSSSSNSNSSAAAAASANNGSSNQGIPSVLDGISDTFLNAFVKVNNPSKVLVDVKEHADKLDENLLGIEKTFGRVVRRQGDLVHDLEEFGQQIQKLSTLVPNLNLEFSEIAKGTHGMSQGLSKLSDEVENDYMSSLRDMEAYLASLKALIKQQEQKQLDFEALTDYLHRAKADKETLLAGGGSNFLRNKVEDLRGVSHEKARRERLAKLEMKIEELTKEVDNSSNIAESFEEFAVNEVKIFNKIKYKEMKDTLQNLSDYNIDFYKEILGGWEKIAAVFD